MPKPAPAGGWLLLIAGNRCFSFVKKQDLTLIAI